eukprot:TRINITY_DN20236_c0_g1_i1.p1 TRINITY_DN20236_c0_g1~~TRINITY_DN20236_c0_g1_i1.p1  ORF type:complete len:824 (+),score=83.42 TRINITY_DN20236_c0_g1_i1:5069-7540(+)
MSAKQYAKQSKKQKKEFNIFDFEPIFEDDLLVNADGRVAIGYKISGIEFQKWDSAQYEQLARQLTNTIADLPLDTVIQYMDVYYNLPYKGPKVNSYLEQKANEYFNDRLLLKHEAYIYISFPKSSKEVKASPVSTVFAKLGGFNNIYENIEDRISSANTISRKFQSGVNSLGDISIQRLTDEENMDFYYRYFNFDFASQPKDYLREINKMPAQTVIGEKEINIVTLGEQGDEWYTSRPDYFGVHGSYSYPLSSGLDFPHITSTSIWVEDTQLMLKDLDLKKMLNIGVASKMGASQDNEILVEDLDGYTKYIREQKINLVRFNVSVIIPSEDKWTKSERLREVEQAFKNIEGAKPYIEAEDTTALFFALAPGNSAQNYRWLKGELTNACVYMPFTTNFYPDEAGVLLTDRAFNPVLFNNFDENLDAQNAQVVGPTGAGKSVTIGYFILQDFFKGIRQMIIDKGGTYKNLVHFLGGKYYEYTEENPLKLNPFNLEKEKVIGSGGAFRYKVTLAKKEFLISFLTLIWKGSSEKLNQAENSVLMDLITQYYEQLEPGTVAKIADFYVWLSKYIDNGEKEQTKNFQENSQGINFSQLKLVLRQFAEGAYKDICNADESEDISDNKLVCFDMNNIQKNETIFPLVSLMVTELTNDICDKFAKDIKKIYLDECWSFMVSLDKYIEELYRTIRKKRGCIWTISQSVNEFATSPIASVLKLNSHYKFVLRHEGKEATIQGELRDYFELTDNEVQKCLSLIKRVKSREIAVKKGDYMKVYNVEIPDEMMVILTSKPAERELFNEILKAKKGKYAVALREYIEHIYHNSPLKVA